MQFRLHLNLHQKVEVWCNITSCRLKYAIIDDENSLNKCIKFIKTMYETEHFIKAAELPSITNVTTKHDYFKNLDGTNIFKLTMIHPV